MGPQLGGETCDGVQEALGGLLLAVEAILVGS